MWYIVLDLFKTGCKKGHPFDSEIVSQYIVSEIF